MIPRGSGYLFANFLNVHCNNSVSSAVCMSRRLGWILRDNSSINLKNNFRLLSQTKSRQEGKKKPSVETSVKSNSEDLDQTQIKEVIQNADQIYYQCLERYYNNTILEEQLILQYKHDDYHGEEELDKEIERLNTQCQPVNLVESLFSVDKKRIPTFPNGKVVPLMVEDRDYISQDKATSEIYLSEYRRANFLDPSYIGGGHLKVESELPIPKLEVAIPKLPKPLNDVPKIEHISLTMPFNDEKTNDISYLKAKTLLCLISGINAGPCVFKEKSTREYVDAEEILVGAKTVLSGPDLYSFLDKTVRIVMPNIANWDGLTPIAGQTPGSIYFMVPAEYVLFYPDIYSIRNHISELFDLHVVVYTSAPCVNTAATILSAFQFPFIDNKKYENYSMVPSSITNPTIFRGGHLYELSLSSSDP